MKNIVNGKMFYIVLFVALVTLVTLFIIKVGGWNAYVGYQAERWNAFTHIESVEHLVKTLKTDMVNGTMILFR